MAEGDIELVITLDDGQVVKGLVAAEKASLESGKKIGENLSSSASGGFSLLNASLLGLAATFASVFAGTKIIDAATRQEDAVNKLNQALRSAGQFSKEASLDFQKFASEIQQTTTLGDEAVLEYAALARQFTKTNEDAKKLTSAAIELSAATGISTEQAIRQLGGSLSGFSGNLGKVIPGVKELTEEQLKSGAALDLVSQRFAGSAGAKVNTFSGALSQLKNTFNGVLEVLGSFITGSPSLVATIKFISTKIKSVISFFSNLKEESGDVFKPFISIGIDVVKFLVNILGRGIELTIGAFKTLGNRIGALAAVFVEFFTGNFSGAFELFEESNRQVASDIQEVFQFAGTKSAVAFLDEFQQAIETAGNVAEPIEEPIQEIAESIAPIKESLQENFIAPVEEAKNKATEFGNLLAGSVKNLVVSSISTIGASLVQGGKAFSNFGKTALNILGDFAIQLGTFFVTSGLGIEALKTAILSFSGGIAIAAGVALIALGGALKAFAGGPSALSGSGQSIGNSATNNVADESIRATNDVRSTGAQVTINVQGDIFDRRESGLQIAEILRESFDSNQVVFNP
jgi:hypothetical protein